MNTPKPWYKSKTIWLNIIAFLIAAVPLVSASSIVPPQWTDGFALVVALLNLALRFLTTQPIEGGPKT